MQVTVEAQPVVPGEPSGQRVFRDGVHRRRIAAGDAGDQVISLRGTRIDITGPPTPINADGELSAPTTHPSWRVRPRAWRIAAP